MASMEGKSQVEAAKRSAEEKKRKAEEAKRLAEKKKRKAEEAKRLAEKKKRKAEEAKRVAEVEAERLEKEALAAKLAALEEAQRDQLGVAYKGRSQAEREEIQQRLSELGLYRFAIDGMFW